MRKVRTRKQSIKNQKELWIKKWMMVPSKIKVVCPKCGIP